MCPDAPAPSETFFNLTIISRTVDVMNAVIIGASDRSSVWRHGSIREGDYEKLVSEYARFLAERFDNLIVSPDDGVYTDIALEFGRIKGKKPIAYYPDKDEFYGIGHIRQNFPNYDLRPIGGGWYDLNADLTKKALCVICIGFTPGALIEAAFIKYHQKYASKKDSRLKDIHLMIDERCISTRLPPSFEEQIDNIFYYSSLDELGAILSRRRDVLGQPDLVGVRDEK
jgi:hypothetical protein